MPPSLPEKAWLLATRGRCSGTPQLRARPYHLVVQQGRRGDTLTLRAVLATKNRDTRRGCAAHRRGTQGRGGSMWEDTYSWVLYRVRPNRGSKERERTASVSGQDARLALPTLEQSASPPAPRPPAHGLVKQSLSLTRS